MAEVLVFDSAATAGALVADHIVAALRVNGGFTLGVATGSTPLPVYEALSARAAQGVDFSSMFAFALDEYVGLPEGHPQSYRSVIEQAVTVPLGLKPERVHVPDGSLENIETAGDRYEEALIAHGGVDLQLLGIGTTGHIGFNEPGSSFGSLTRVKTLTERTRADNARFFASPEDVPIHCVTQGLGTILRARHLVLLAFGEGKAAAIAAAVEGPITASLPGSALQFHPHVTVLLDRQPRRSCVSATTTNGRRTTCPIGKESELYTDIHCHGGGGHSFGDSVEGTLAALAAHRVHGTSRVVASLVSEPLERTARAMAVIREAMAIDAGILGVHLEGPFLSPERKGAHDPAALAVPTPDVVEALLEAADGIIRQITIAPELPHALDAISRFVDAGVVVAVGHCDADAGVAREAFDRGATLVTHAFNAMKGITGRAPGVVGAALADDRVTLEVIADGMHVDPTLIAMLFRAAPGRVALMTDAMAAAAAAEGRYLLGGLEVDVEGGKAVIAGTDTLAGSTLTMDRAVEVCIAAGVPADEALAAATTVPAAVLGLT